jgi:hypothetical protein
MEAMNALFHGHNSTDKWDMCGGISFSLEGISWEELAKFLEPSELDAFRKEGRGRSVFWGRRPILPVRLSRDPKSGIHIFDWGNREKGIDMPRTGWAKYESLQAGRWNWLRPTKVLIPAIRGVEKGRWFDIDGAIAGVLVESDDVRRAYMVTVPASREYQELTGHGRMPKIVTGDK